MMMTFQAGSYQFYQVPIIKDWLEAQLGAYGTTAEERLYDMSDAIEPPITSN